jgi:hypothetical protein
MARVRAKIEIFPKDGEYLQSLVMFIAKDSELIQVFGADTVEDMYNLWEVNASLEVVS